MTRFKVFWWRIYLNDLVIKYFDVELNLVEFLLNLFWCLNKMYFVMTLVPNTKNHRNMVNCRIFKLQKCIKFPEIPKLNFHYEAAGGSLFWLIAYSY